MSTIRSTGLPQVTVIPTAAPTTNGPRFVQVEDSNTFGCWNGASWETIELTPTASTAYKAILAQTGVADPTATIAVNSLGEVPTLDTTGVGVYEINVTGGQFTAKTIIQVSVGSTTAIDTVKWNLTSTNKITIKTALDGVAADIEGTLSVSIETFV